MDRTRRRLLALSREVARVVEGVSIVLALAVLMKAAVVEERVV